MDTDTKMKIQECSIDGTIVTINYPLIGKSASLDYAALSNEMKVASGLHGIKQVGGDEFSGAKLNVKDVTQKWEQATRKFASILNGSWKVERGANESSVIEAVAEETKQTEEAVREFLKPLSKEDRKAKVTAWRTATPIKLRMAIIETRKLKKLTAKDETPFEMK